MIGLSHRSDPSPLRLTGWLCLAVLAACSSACSTPEPEPEAPTAEAAPVADASREPVAEMGWRTVEVVASDVSLDESRPDLHEVGAAHFRAGFTLQSTDPAFGGFSGLLLDGDRLLAVSDQGHWWRATLRHDETGRLVGLVDSEMAPLADLDGRQVSGRMRRDAEELVRIDSHLVVTFEGDHRSHVYVEAGHPEPTLGPSPDAMAEAPENGGMEAVTRLTDGRLLVVAEDVLDDDGNLRAWLSDAALETWSDLAVATEPDYKATAATTLPAGDVLLLQRFWTPELGTRVRMVRLPANELARAASADGSESGLVVGHELARFQAPLSVDNFEAVDVGSGPDGQVYAYLLADDNYSENQRTLLFQLELPR